MVLVHYEQGCNNASTCGPGLLTNTDSNSVSASYAVPSKEIKVTCYYCKVAPRACVCVLFFVLGCIEGRDFERAAVNSLFEWRSSWGSLSSWVSPEQVNIPGARKHFARQSWMICIVSWSLLLTSPSPRWRWSEDSHRWECQRSGHAHPLLFNAHSYSSGKRVTSTIELSVENSSLIELRNP